MNHRSPLETIRSHGGRVTKIRRALIECLAATSCLLTDKELTIGLRERGIRPHRSTLFRELRYLLSIGVIERRRVAGDDSYELTGHEHQHLVCVRCEKVEKAHLDKEARAITERLARSRFRALGSIDVYGLCGSCRASA